MSIVSPQFFVFVTLLVCLYYTIFRKCAWVLLLVASYAFYFLNEPINIVYLIITTSSVYLSGILIDRTNRDIKNLSNLDRDIRKNKKELLEKKKKRILVFALILNFLMLSVFKYSAYFYSIIGLISNKFGALNFLYREEINTKLLNILQPLGISFFIFQATGYLIDVYRNKFEAEKNPFKFALFVSYFPQIVQGPIGRWNLLKDDLFKTPNLDYDNLRDGIILIVFGLFKKVEISNRISVIVNAVFSEYTGYSGVFVFLSVLFYGIQIYTDFSGGIDIVRGVSKLFGVELSLNFKQPFFATSIADFWRRWHITLGTWLKDYVFYPVNFSKPMFKLNKFGRKHLGAKYGKFLSLSVSTFLIYFIVGIWHGAGFKYVAFGIWNGTIITISLVLEEFFINTKAKLGIKDGKLYRIFMILRTNILVCIGRFFTRASGFLVALRMIKYSFSNFNLNGINLEVFRSFSLTKYDYLRIILGVTLLLICDYLAEIGFGLKSYLERKSKLINYIFIIVIVLFLFIGVFYQNSYVSTEFIYRQY